MTATVASPRQAAPGRGGLSRRVTAGHVFPLVLAILASVATLAALKDRSATVVVAVARTNIAVGSPISPGQLTWEKVPADSVLARHGLIGRDQLGAGETAAVSIPAGQPITTAELAMGGAGLGLGSMSIDVSVARADGGGIHAGDRVDVISTGSGHAAYVATDLLVLAVAPTGSGAVFGASADNGYFVTVAVDRAAALAIAAAEGATSAGGSGGIEVVRSTGEGPAPGTTSESGAGCRASGRPGRSCC